MARERLSEAVFWSLAVVGASELAGKNNDKRVLVGIKSHKRRSSTNLKLDVA